MHAVLAMSMLHTEHLRRANSTPSPPSRYAIHHWQQSLTQFSKSMTPAITRGNADAVLVTSTLINAIAFCLVDTSELDKCWPLSSAPSDLQWLSIQKGIGLISRATQQLGRTSKIKDLFDEGRDGFQEAEITSETVMLCAPDLAELCDISPLSTVQNNAYFGALQRLAPMIQVPCNPSTIFAHLAFLAAVSSSFLSLLCGKDHRALLLLSYWYANVAPFNCWWIGIRSKLEGAAICKYLEREAEDRIVSLLGYPAKGCGFGLTRQVRDASTDSQVEAQTLMPCTPM